ncbi:carbonic anhydrase 2 [Musca autumnalis]|uniref:carbonic anhydrase 2 n=1 Tax=Musca autumnalis TaxID=221902 RepID=UPI003CF86336
MKVFNLLLLLIATIISCGHGESEFTYYGSMGPDHWSEHYNQCAGKHQSPININDVDVIGRGYEEIKYENFDKEPINATMTNNGHTVLVRLIYDDQAPLISGGPLSGKGNYEFQQLHFHWGEDNTVGSEDRINNVSFPMELHIVFRNIRYKDFAEASQRDDGIAVMAFFYEISEEQNADHDYDTFTSNLEKIELPNSMAKVDSVTLFGLMPENRQSYYTYIGSLTTPPCSEDVIWLDFISPISIAGNLLERFRSLKTYDGTPLTHNFRPVQPLNNRKVYKAMPHERVHQEGGASSIPIVDAWDNAASTSSQSFVLCGILMTVVSILTFNWFK